MISVDIFSRNADDIVIGVNGKSLGVQRIKFNRAEFIITGILLDDIAENKLETVFRHSAGHNRVTLTIGEITISAVLSAVKYKDKPARINGGRLVYSLTLSPDIPERDKYNILTSLILWASEYSEQI